MGKKLDEFFKDGLSEPDLQMLEADWAAMEKVLDKHQNKNDLKSIAYVWISGLAAMLIIAFFLVSRDVQPTLISIAKKKTDVQKTITTDQNRVASATHSTHVEKKSGRKTKVRVGSGSINTLNVNVNVPNLIILHHTGIASQKSKAKELDVITNNESSILLQQKDLLINDQRSAVLVLDTVTQTSPTLKDSPIEKSDQFVKADELDKSTGSAIIKTKYKKSLVLSINAGSDVNAVGSLKKGGLGTNAGLLATWQVSPKFSLTSGIVYAKKLYDSEYENYKPSVPYSSAYHPLGVRADCRVLDIPININYSLWQNSKEKILISGGASSYLMLKERYDFLYTGYTHPITYYGENQHYLGVLNFAMAYERITGSKTSISLQPYLKLPITGIGQGNVNLISTGLSVNFNLNVKRK